MKKMRIIDTSSRSYIKPNIEIINFDYSDIICKSECFGGVSTPIPPNNYDETSQLFN